MSKVSQIIEELKELSLLEAAELVKAIEETFGVSAAAPVAVAAAPAGGDAAPAAEEKTEFTVVVEAVPADKKIAILKEVKNIKGIGLGEAKALVESAPFNVAENIAKDAATEMKDKLAAAGATVTLK